MLTQAEIDKLIASRDKLAEHLRKEIKFNLEQAAEFEQLVELKIYFNGTVAQHRIALIQAGISEE